MSNNVTYHVGKKKKEKINIEIDEHDPTVIIVNGEKFRPVKLTSKKIDGIIHKDKIIYKRVDELDFENDLKILVDTLAKKTTTKELLTEILKNGMSVPALKRYVKEIKERKPIKKHHGCLGFKIGKSYIQLID